MASEKDRMGDKLQKKEQGEEEQYFQKRERELLEKLRQARPATTEVRHCPQDGAVLVKRREHSVTIDECPTCNGIWLDRGELELIAQRERDSWIARMIYAPRR